jgi:hypothetical protein
VFVIVVAVAFGRHIEGLRGWLLHISSLFASCVEEEEV